MPVISALAPAFSEQYPTGAGGGYDPYQQPLMGGVPQMPQQPQQPVPPAAPGTNVPPGYTPGSVPYGQQSPANPFNPLEDAQGSIVRALLARGINPAQPGYGITQLLRRAEDIVRGVVGRAAYAGQQEMLAGPGFQQAINDLIAHGGGAYISGGEQGRQGLNAIASLIDPSRSTGQTPGLGTSMLEALFREDPDNARKLAGSLLYGALNSTVRSAAERPLALFPEMMQQFVEQPAGWEAMQGRSALSALLNGTIPGYSPFPGTSTQSALGAAPGVR